jgi:uncharacterized integral membrane protein (TIGR00698 family)
MTDDPAPGFPMRKTLFLSLLAFCAIPRVSTGVGLALGVTFSLLLRNPWPKATAKYSKTLLQISVVGLGFGMEIGQVWQVGKSSLVYTFVGIACTLAVGALLGKALKTPRATSILVSFGTAICGGSAIAAMAPVINAENEEVAVSIATVFTLNALALFLFPPVGHFLHLTQEAFGVWAGIAIHDTSSVVGASSAFGPAALAIGTTVKLSRAIWIAPCVMVYGRMLKSEGKASIPLFIVGFIAAAIVRSALPGFLPAWQGIAAVARQSLVVTLFLIGAGLSIDVLKNVGIRPMLQGVLLWFLVGIASLAAISGGLIP